MSREFVISYFSEVTAVITVVASDGYIRAEAKHPSKIERDLDVDLLPNWFHFSHGSGVDRYDTDNDFGGDLTVTEYINGSRREAILNVLHVLAKQLCPDPRPLMQEHEPPGVNTDNNDEMYHHFRQVVLHAYMTGSYCPAGGIHQLGKRHWIDEWTRYRPSSSSPSG